MMSRSGSEGDMGALLEHDQLCREMSDGVCDG